MSEINTGNILTGVKILIVDGVPDHLEMYKLSIEITGAEVKTSESISGAMEICKDWIPDIVISDLSLPGESENESIKKIREALSAHNEIAYIALSTKQETDIAITLGYDKFLRKPIKRGVLINSIVKLAKKSPVAIVKDAITSAENKQKESVERSVLGKNIYSTQSLQAKIKWYENIAITYKQLSPEMREELEYWEQHEKGEASITDWPGWERLIGKKPE